MSDDAISWIKEAYSYDPETGVISWKISRGRRRAGMSAGYPCTTGYRRIKINKKPYFEHRVVWVLHYGHWPSKQIDHINGNRSDNRIVNLRDVSHTENQQNKFKASSCSSSGLIGAYPYAPNKWRSQIQFGGKTISIGMFSSKEEAHAAYLKTKRELHNFSTVQLRTASPIAQEPT